MTVPLYDDFDKAISTAQRALKHAGKEVHPARWQGMDVSGNPAARMREFLFFSFGVIPQSGMLEDLRRQIKPNLPWADDHFEERVSGEPLNPGEQWRRWPYAHSADKHRTEDRAFTHTYMERYWPRHANAPAAPAAYAIHRGIRYEYGDLAGVVRLLQSDPDTRQAFLPVWFPEDTGDVHTGRKPCTLGYHFIIRNHHLHVVYYIRSCDFVRHFRDDIYLTMRLMLWVSGQLDSVAPGEFYMHITSLHCFINDQL